MATTEDLDTRSGDSRSALHNTRTNESDAGSTPEKSSAGKLMARISGFRDLLGVVFLPILNIIFTAAMMGLLIYAFATANGQNLDYTIGSMSVPSYVSLITTLLKMGVMGGIGYAISEYKWVRLQSGGQLSLLDVYDACTRGFGGVIRVLLSFRVDTILIPAVIFQIGLIAMGPAAQQILAAYDATPVCDYQPPQRELSFFNVSRSPWFNDYALQRRAARVKGIYLSYIPAIGFGSAFSNHTRSDVYYYYNIYSINTTWNDIPTLRNDIECVPGSFADTRIISDQTLNVSTLTDYFGNGQPIQVPRMLYAASMFNRTHYDRERLVYDVFDTSGYHPEDRALVGEQTFVAVTDRGQASSGTLNNPASEATVEQCTLRSYLANSRVEESGALGTKVVMSWEGKQAVEMDYDLLVNGTYWKDRPWSTGTTFENAYAYQLTLMSTMTDRANIKFHQQAADRWASVVQNMEGVDTYFTNYIRDGFLRGEEFMTFYAVGSTTPSKVWGVSCFVNETKYNIDPAAYLGLSLAPTVPLAWWVVLWIISLYQTNGISRGNSQIALLATGLTHRVSDRFRGFSHASQHRLFDRASKVKAWFGQIRRDDGRRGHVAFGLENEIRPLRVQNQHHDDAA